MPVELGEIQLKGEFLQAQRVVGDCSPRGQEPEAVGAEFKDSLEMPRGTFPGNHLELEGRSARSPRTRLECQAVVVPALGSEDPVGGFAVALFSFAGFGFTGLAVDRAVQNFDAGPLAHPGPYFLLGNRRLLELVALWVEFADGHGSVDLGSWILLLEVGHMPVDLVNDLLIRRSLGRACGAGPGE